MFVGLESLEAETLRRWGKAVDPAALLKAVVRCRAAGIETAVGYILWHERSTPESVREQMQTLSRYDLLDPKSALSRLIVFPGSRLYEEAGAFGPARPVSLPPRAAAAYRSWRAGSRRFTGCGARPPRCCPASAAATIFKAAGTPMRCGRCWRA